ncbi:hypothetical protein KGM_209619 [Danaus plexippus plexippus]|uniref:Uncharacterized protein n=1 Tax=Danaus plexippus plexippus TaxID=278856 RepID=A0A212EVK3_DANPL|nr:hypothetical protein KGM_209619 [Danaus plexippus plexippus]
MLVSISAGGVLAGNVTGGVCGTRGSGSVGSDTDRRAGPVGCVGRGVDVGRDVTVSSEVDVAGKAEVGGRISEMFVATVQRLTLDVVGGTVAFEESALKQIKI